MSILSAQEVLAALRWSVRRSKPLEIGPELSIRLIHDSEAPSLLALELTFMRRTQKRWLAKEHVETRGRSVWFKDNTWRLSEKGIEFFAPSLTDVMNDPRRLGARTVDETSHYRGEG